MNKNEKIVFKKKYSIEKIANKLNPVKDFGKKKKLLSIAHV